MRDFVVVVSQAIWYVLQIEIYGQVNLPARNFRQDDDEGDEMTWDERLRMYSYNV